MRYKLMLKTHDVTGLKYLCITTKKDWKSYRGSGFYWKAHLKQHGRGHISTELLYETDNYEEFKAKCHEYSNSLDIVNSDEFANLIPETGELGGNIFSMQSIEKQQQIREKCKASQSRAPRSQSVRTAISKTKLNRTPEEKQAWKEKMQKHFREGLNSHLFEKWKTSRRGANNPAAKKVKIDGIIYESISDAMNATGLERHTITNRCKSDKFPTYERL